MPLRFNYAACDIRLSSCLSYDVLIIDMKVLSCTDKSAFKNCLELLVSLTELTRISSTFYRALYFYYAILSFLNWLLTVVALRPNTTTVFLPLASIYSFSPSSSIFIMFMFVVNLGDILPAMDNALLFLGVDDLGIPRWDASKPVLTFLFLLTQFLSLYSAVIFAKSSITS